jgi:nitroreductase
MSLLATEQAHDQERASAAADVRASVISVLLTRSSVAPKTLRAPGPGAEDMRTLIAAALAAPDHEALRPCRFIAIEGAGRLQLSQAFVQIRKKRPPKAGPEELARTWRKTMRAPTLIGVVARLVRDHPKVPVHEQYISIGAAIHGIMLACHAMGYGAIMLSGNRSRDLLVGQLLGLVDDKEMVGFISIGTPSKRVNPKRRPSPDDHLQVWRGREGMSAP